MASVILLVAKPYLVGLAPADRFAVQATDKDGRVQLQWNAQSDLVVNAHTALLDVQDGTVSHRYPVEAKVLRSGALDYMRTSDDVTVTFTLLRDGQPTGQAIVRSIGPIHHVQQETAAAVTRTTGTRARRRDHR